VSETKFQTLLIFKDNVLFPESVFLFFDGLALCKGA